MKTFLKCTTDITKWKTAEERIYDIIFEQACNYVHEEEGKERFYSMYGDYEHAFDIDEIWYDACENESE